jgi:hypothetical protein
MDGVAAELQVSVDQVEEKECPKVADVRVVVDGRAASVDADRTRLQRLEVLE